jgi:hypothetical protein
MIGDNGAQLLDAALGLFELFHGNANGETGFQKPIELRATIVHSSKVIQVREPKGLACIHPKSLAVAMQFR